MQQEKEIKAIEPSTKDYFIIPAYIIFSCHCQLKDCLPGLLLYIGHLVVKEKYVILPMTTSVRAPYACSKRLRHAVAWAFASSASLRNRRYFLRFAGERRQARRERGARDTRDWGRRVSGAPRSLAIRTLDISPGVVGLKTALLGGTLIPASTDVASNSLSWIFSLLKLLLDSVVIHCPSQHFSTPRSVGLSSTPAVLFLQKESNSCCGLSFPTD